MQVSDLTNDELTFGAKACDIHRQHVIRRASDVSDERVKESLMAEASAVENLSRRLKQEQNSRLGSAG